MGFVGVACMKHTSVKYVLLVFGISLLFFVFQGMAYSQSDNDPPKDQKNERVDRWTKKLKDKLNLSDEQAAKVHDILSSASDDVKKDMDRYRADIKRDVKDRISKVDTDIKSMLTTDEQKEQYDKMREKVAASIDKRLSDSSNTGHDRTYYRPYPGYVAFGWYPGFWYPRYFARPYFGYRFRPYYHPYYSRPMYRPRAFGGRRFGR